MLDSNPGRTSEPSGGSDSGTSSASAHVDAAQAHQYHRPSGIDRYIREVDQYNAWLGGSQHANTPRIEGKAYYLGNWDRNWQRLDTASNLYNHARSDGTGAANDGRGSNSGGGPNRRRDSSGQDEFYGRESSYDRESRCGADSPYDEGSRQDKNVSQTRIRSRPEASFNGKGNRNGEGDSHHNTLG